MTTSRSLPSLDGLRAGSIALVVLGHSLAYMHGEPNYFPFVQLSELGQSGVDVFFVISGFLITHILLKEYDAAGTVQLRTFYFRRFFRIFPPFYAYLAVVGILWLFGVFPQDARAFVSAATYSWNYLKHPQSWLLGHTWSLSLEEQFYLLWPPCLVLLGRKRSTYLALGLIAISPAIRLLSYVIAPSWRGNEWAMLHTRLDIIMFGCAIALLWKEQRFQKVVSWFLHPLIFAFAVTYVAVIAPCLSASFAAPYDWTVGYTLRGLMVSVVLLYALKRPESSPGLVLNRPAIRHIGVISYSLYLWQQMFTGPNTFLVPMNVVVIFACAETSYWLVERPSFWLRDRIATALEPVPVAAAHGQADPETGEGQSAYESVLVK